MSWGSVSCKNEIKLSNIYLTLDDSRFFYKSQWSKNWKSYLLYRTVVFCYMISWLIYQLVYEAEREILYKYMHFFTNIQVLCINLYFLVSLLVALYGVSCVRNLDALEATPSRWFHKITLLLHTLCFNASLVTILLFWTLLASNSDRPLVTPINFHVHGVTLLLMIIDLFVIKLPVRLLHFVYTSVLGLLYVLYTFILHVTGVQSAVYSFLNWEKSPGNAVGMGLLFSICGAVAGQTVAYCLYRVRLLLRRSPCCYSCCPNECGDESLELSNSATEKQEKEGFENAIFANDGVKSSNDNTADVV